MMKHYKLPVDNEEFNNIIRLEQVRKADTEQALDEPLKSRFW